MVAKLTVLFDNRCGVCRFCKGWLETQNKYVPLETVALYSEEAWKRYPGLRNEAGVPVFLETASGWEINPNAKEDLTVVDDEGGVYYNTDAWIMCLYALKDYRIWSGRLNRPALRPLAKNIFCTLSKYRKSTSQVLWHSTDDELRTQFTTPQNSRAGACNL
jgi:predicted DCC family thiol-disulfide oxidoreductase YuxK